MMALQFISIKISIVIISILFKMSILESLKSYSIPSEFTVPDRMVGFLIAFFICACLSNVNYKLKMLLDSKIDLVLGEKVINSK